MNPLDRTVDPPNSHGFNWKIITSFQSFAFCPTQTNSTDFVPESIIMIYFKVLES